MFTHGGSLPALTATTAYIQDLTYNERHGYDIHCTRSTSPSPSSYHVLPVSIPTKGKSATEHEGASHHHVTHHQTPDPQKTPDPPNRNTGARTHTRSDYFIDYVCSIISGSRMHVSCIRVTGTGDGARHLTFFGFIGVRDR